MSDNDSKTPNRSFKKRAHRPWKTGLLESTLQTTDITSDEDEAFTFDLDLTVEATEDLNSFYPDFNFTDEITAPGAPAKIELPVETLSLDLNDNNLELKQEILQTKQQQQEIVCEITQDKSEGSLKFGGFLQPQQLSTHSSSKNGRKMSSLLSDLKNREQKLNSLTSNLKITQAMERAEQAELTKMAESQGRQAAEQRMRQAIEQAQMAADQFRTAMDRANQAAQAQQEEERLRKSAEMMANEAKLRANNSEIDLQNERLARLSAEERAQHAMIAAERAQVMQRELQEANTRLNRLANVDHQLEEVTNLFSKIDQEHKACSINIHQLEGSVRELSMLKTDHEQKIAELTAQREKLKAIVTAEQDLRKIADRKLQEAIDKAERAEKAWQLAEHQCKVIEDRAKRAIANANNTVMHLLNAPADDSFGVTAAKPTVKAPAPTPATQAYEYEADDLNL